MSFSSPGPRYRAQNNPRIAEGNLLPICRSCQSEFVDSASDRFCKKCKSATNEGSYMSMKVFVVLVLGLVIGFLVSEIVNSADASRPYTADAYHRHVHDVATFDSSFCGSVFPTLRQLKHAAADEAKLAESLRVLNASAHAALNEMQGSVLNSADYLKRSQKVNEHISTALPASFQGAVGKKDEKIKIAICISMFGLAKKKESEITEADLRGIEGYVDAAGIIAESVYQNLQQRDSKYSYDLIAFIDHDVSYLEQFHSKLKFFNYKVIPTGSPVRYDEIAEGYYKQELNRSGCCGMIELMKLSAFTLTDYYRVVLLDTDTLINQQFEELLELPDEVGLIYTNGTMDGEIFQGGFWIVRPNMTVLEGMKSLVRRGAWYSGDAWEHSGIGWLYGGPTIQGLVPYWFMKKEPPNRSIRVSRCIYNNQAAPDCAHTDPTDIKVTHFTLCQKPFKCLLTHRPLCEHAWNEWWRFSTDLETRLGLGHRLKCDPGSRFKHDKKYILIDVNNKSTEH